MTTTIKTPERLLREALIGILDADALALRVDGRFVSVYSFLPEEAFTQKAKPFIVVERPKLDESGPWGGTHERLVYSVQINLVDSMGVRPDSEEVARERVDLLRDKVKAVLGEEANLTLARLHVYWSLCAWEEGEPVAMGNNLIGKPLMVTVPMIVEKDAVLSEG